MIEYNFTELDNDFITCWCKYLLTGDSNMIMKDLETLAELGQINAIQNWYLFKKVGDNPNIDKLADDLADNYNELLVRARIQSKNLLQLEEQERLLAYADEEEFVRGYRYGVYRLTERAKDARRKIENMSFIKLYNNALDKASLIGNRTKDVLVLETANEILFELADKIGINSYKDKMYKNAKYNNKKICDQIVKSIKIKKKENPQYNLLQEPRNCFIFCKAILLYNETHRYKTMAVEMLKNLSERAYSSDIVNKKTTNRK